MPINTGKMTEQQIDIITFLIGAAALSVQAAIKKPGLKSINPGYALFVFFISVQGEIFFHDSLLTNEKWAILSRELLRDVYELPEGKERLYEIYAKQKPSCSESRGLFSVVKVPTL